MAIKRYAREIEKLQTRRRNLELQRLCEPQRARDIDELQGQLAQEEESLKNKAAQVLVEETRLSEVRSRRKARAQKVFECTGRTSEERTRLYLVYGAGPADTPDNERARRERMRSETKQLIGETGLGVKDIMRDGSVYVLSNGIRVILWPNWEFSRPDMMARKRFNPESESEGYDFAVFGVLSNDIGRASRYYILPRIKALSLVVGAGLEEIDIPTECLGAWQSLNVRSYPRGLY